MKRVVSGLWGVAGAAALGVATLLPAGSADAALLVDLRFTDGSKNVNLALPGTYGIDVWAQVTGTNAVADESLTHLYGSVQSQQVNGGAIGNLPGVGVSGITGNTAAPVFTLEAIRGQPGTPQNLTTDGVQDWGTVATNNANTIKYNAALSPIGDTPVTMTTPGVIANTIPNGVEFKVGTLTVTINPEDIGALGGVTNFNWVNGSGFLPRPHTHRIDGSATVLDTSTSYTVPQPGNGVSFTIVPEPTTLGVLGVAGLGLLARRRRQVR